MEDFEREAIRAWQAPPLPVRTIHVTDACKLGGGGVSASYDMVRVTSRDEFPPRLLMAIVLTGAILQKEQKFCEDWPFFHYVIALSPLYDTKEYIAWLREIKPEDWL